MHWCEMVLRAHLQLMMEHHLGVLVASQSLKSHSCIYI